MASSALASYELCLEGDLLVGHLVRVDLLAGGVLLKPQALGLGCPLLGVGRGTRAQVVDILRRDVLRGLGVCLVHDLGQHLGVLQHGAGAQHVVVPGVVLAVGLEDGLAQAVEKVLVLDVGVGVVDEDARLHVTLGVDVAEHAAAGDAATHVLAVVLEVHREDGLAAGDATHLTDAVQHVLALLDGGHEVGVGALPHRHVVEVPGPAGTLVDDEVEVLVGRDRLDVGAGVGRGGTKELARV